MTEVVHDHTGLASVLLQPDPIQGRCFVRVSVQGVTAYMNQATIWLPSHDLVAALIKTIPCARTNGTQAAVSLHDGKLSLIVRPGDSRMGITLGLMEHVRKTGEIAVISGGALMQLQCEIK